MKNSNTLCCLLVLLAGSCVGFAQPSNPPKDYQPDKNQNADHQRAPISTQPDDYQRNHRQMDNKTQNHLLASADKLVGTDIVNAQKKSLGSIDDFVIDRGSGQVRFVVMKSGGLLGLGEKTLAVPYDSIRWTGSDLTPTLDATPDQIKAWPEFDKKAWAKGDRSSQWYTDVVDKSYPRDAWPNQQGDANKKISGTIKSFDRRTDAQGRQELVVTVVPAGGTPQEVSLGPSWYVAGNNSIAMYRDTPVDITVYTVDRNGTSEMVARSIAVNGKQIGFYDDKGSAAWNNRDNRNDNRDGDRDANRGDRYSSTSPVVLYSDIDGKDIDCRGTDCGEVENALLDTGSGRMAFLVIDPDENFLGIADTKRLAPWSIMTTAADGTVHLDANKQMIADAPQMPSDLHTMSTMTELEPVYKAYSVQPPMDNGISPDRPYDNRGNSRDPGHR